MNNDNGIINNLMFKSSLGEDVDQEVPIFPLISYNPDRNIWKCVGTGFFIQPLGGFVTAKHVFYDNSGRHLPTLYAVQTTSGGERHIRVLKHFVPHPNADIAVGFLGRRRLPNGVSVTPEVSVPLTLNFEKQIIGNSIRTYAFPLTEREALGDGTFELTFGGKWATGAIIDYHEDGSSIVRNRCYQTTMKIEHGASGGPVLRNDLVIGVNSSGMNVLEGQAPISFITPIDLILDLSVPEGGEQIPIKMLIEKGIIAAK